MCASERQNKTERLQFPKCQFLPANHTHNVHEYSQEKGKQKKKRTHSTQTAVAAFWLMGLILRKSSDRALNSVCMCIGQIKKCQSSGKHYYALPHLFSIKKVFSSYLPLPSKGKKKKEVWWRGEKLNSQTGYLCFPVQHWGTLMTYSILHIFITQNITYSTYVIT